MLVLHYFTVDVDECAQSNPCQDGCVNTVSSFVCNCSSGYLLSSNGHTCLGEDLFCMIDYIIATRLDVNECSTGNGGCSQICTNTVGTYSCGCTSGYTLSNDTISCLGEQ